MGALKLLFSSYWEPILALTLCLSIVGYVGYQRHEIKSLERDNASLQQTIDLTKAVGQAQNEKTARIEQGAHQAAILSANQYLSDLEKVKKYNEAHPTIKRIVVNSVRQPTTDSNLSQLPETGTSTQGTNDGAADSMVSESSITEDCTVTTLMLLHLQKFEQEQQAIQ